MVTECGFCDRGRIRFIPTAPLEWCPHCHGTNDATNPDLRTEIIEVGRFSSGAFVIKQHGGPMGPRSYLLPVSWRTPSFMVFCNE